MPQDPVFPGVLIEELRPEARPIEAAPTSVTAFVGRAPTGPVNEPVRVRSWVAFEEMFGVIGAERTLALAVHLFFANGGTDAVIVRVAHAYAEDGSPIDDAELTDDAVVPTDPQAVQRRQGIYALDGAGGFNLLCLPPPSQSRDWSVATWAHAAAFCEQRRAFLLIDPPTIAHMDVGEMTDILMGFADDLRQAMGADPRKNAALYCPHLLVSHPNLSAAASPMAPCGAVAGVMARTDRDRGVWKAPAGMGAWLVGIQGLSHALNDTMQGALNQSSINGLRSFPQSGPVIWGSRTLAGAESSDWRYVPARRTALFLQQSVEQGLDWVVFEPNGEPLWAKVRLTVGRFMDGMFRQGAFQGSSPRDAWFVRCDAFNMTQDDLDAGRLIVEIGFAPLRPAEFNLIRIQKQTQR